MCSPTPRIAPSPLGGGTHYTIHLLSGYMRLVSPLQIREDATLYGFYLAKGENEAHDAIALEKLKLKFNLVLDGQVEKRKNSWVNSLNYNLRVGNDVAIASMIASFWRRILSETSLKKAKKSAYGYALNGNCRSKGKHEKELIALCEWCSKEITVPLNNGFTCPYCGVYFQNFRPQKIKIKPNFENFYFEEFDKNEEINESLNKIKNGEYYLKKAKKNNAAQLVFSIDN